MKIIRGLIKVLDNIIDIGVLSVLLLLLAYGIFVLVDTEDMYHMADRAEYSAYRPTQEDSTSFEELRAINPEVFGWLTVYGTNIDYPLVQAGDNDKYIYTDAKGNYAAFGSIFLDYRNNRDLSDFNSIIYGHHMDKKVMFGEIADFREESFFNSHRYGGIYCNGKSYGLEFFAFLEVDTSGTIYKPGIKDSEKAEEWLDNLMQKSIYIRDYDVGLDDHIVLLSTCTSDITNGRHILAGKLLQEVPDNPFQDEEVEIQEEQTTTLITYLSNLPIWTKIAAAMAILTLGVVSVNIVRRYRERRKK